MAIATSSLPSGELGGLSSRRYVIREKTLMGPVFLACS
jgi:hypothetical protein